MAQPIQFRILSVRLTGRGSYVTFESIPGRRYQVQTRDVLVGGGWRTIASDLTASTSVTQFLDRTAVEDIRFYRVLLLP